MLVLLVLAELVNSATIPSKNLKVNNLRSVTDIEDTWLTIPELIRKYGYPSEQYFVTTPDDYILEVHRIPHGKNSKKPPKDVVFLQHGLLGSSACWIIAGPEKSLGYILADEGYDVWMGNARGSKLSRNHTYLDPDNSDEFWDFSWHEIGYYDLPAMIDFALNKTQKESLFHVGHSQGTTTFYVMTSTRPEYNAKIKAHFSLAPIAYMSHMTSPLMHILSFWERPITALSKLIGVREFLPSVEFITMAGNIICSDDSITQVLCTNAFFIVSGFSPEEMNATLLPVISGHMPAGASIGQVMHYAQEINSGRFRQYDHGFKNFEKYGSRQPPDYELDKITAPVYLHYSNNDWLAGVVDVERLSKELGNCTGKLLVEEESFNHIDYIFGINAPDLVYNKMISLMGRH